MPHFVIECSQNVLQLLPANAIMSAVYEAAETTGLFAQNDIKVRLLPYEDYILGKGHNSFLHVFGYIMQGRTEEEREGLSRAVISRLNEVLPEPSFLAMNVSEFEATTYTNRALLHPQNLARDRHFDPARHRAG